MGRGTYISAQEDGNIDARGGGPAGRNGDDTVAFSVTLTQIIQTLIPRPRIQTPLPQPQFRSNNMRIFINSDG